MVNSFLVGVLVALLHGIAFVFAPIDQSWRPAIIGASFGGSFFAGIYWMVLTDKGLKPNPGITAGIGMMGAAEIFGGIYYLTLFERFSFPPLIVAASFFLVGGVLYNITSKFYPNLAAKNAKKEEESPPDAPAS